MIREEENLEARWRCRDGIILDQVPNGSLFLRMQGRESVRIPTQREFAGTVLRLNDGLSDKQVGEACGGDTKLMALMFNLVNQLRAGGVLAAELFYRDRHLATIRPVKIGFSIPDDAMSAPEVVKSLALSRFALLRREGSDWILESPEALCDVVIREREIVGWLLNPSMPDLSPGTVGSQILVLLSRLGFLSSCDEAESTSQRMWEFHDRLFHVSTRALRGMRPFGGTFRFLEQHDENDSTFPAPPPLREPYEGETVELQVPEMNASGRLSDVMESRRSNQAMGDPPVEIDRVAALLYRSVRVTRRVSDDTMLRPYPSGGSTHELEFYLAVRSCSGLKKGFFHYRCDMHALTRLPGKEPVDAAEDLIRDCALTWGVPDALPQVVIVVSSRLPRVAWKYEGIAYRLSLMSAGAALQNLYLVATDLGLSGCASGAGRPEVFARATGVSSWMETSIAEFGLGSMPAD